MRSVNGDTFSRWFSNLETKSRLCVRLCSRLDIGYGITFQAKENSDSSWKCESFYGGGSWMYSEKFLGNLNFEGSQHLRSINYSRGMKLHNSTEHPNETPGLVAKSVHIEKETRLAYGHAREDDSTIDCESRTGSEYGLKICTKFFGRPPIQIWSLRRRQQQRQDSSKEEI